MSDLASRIAKNERSFQVYNLPTSSRQPYFKIFSLRDDSSSIIKDRSNPINYFTAMNNDGRVLLDRDTFVCIYEYEGDTIVSEEHIYCTNSNKPILSWNIEPAPNYEYRLNPHIITITWSGKSETIDSSRIWLCCKKNNNRYKFLTDQISAVDGCAKFIISLPADIPVSKLEVCFDEDVRLKYQIRRGS